MFPLVEVLPLCELGPLNLQNPELWRWETQMLPGVMVRVRPLLLAPLDPNILPIGNKALCNGL